ncbi:MAG: hypothetical protein ACRDSF_26860 [Pseudonocardiaceae bacterium]
MLPPLSPTPTPTQLTLPLERSSSLEPPPAYTQLRGQAPVTE